MPRNGEDDIVNSVDPDQMAPEFALFNKSAAGKHDTPPRKINSI